MLGSETLEVTGEKEGFEVRLSDAFSLFYYIITMSKGHLII